MQPPQRPRATVESTGSPGTVEEGEDLQAAVIREVWEETGLDAGSPPRHLGLWANELAAQETVACRPTTLFASGSTSSEKLDAVGRGVTMPLLATTDGFVNVSYYAVRDEEPVSLEGWIPSADVSAIKERHFYQIETPDNTPDSWDQEGDQGLTFRLYWSPLKPKPQLVEGQDTWLDFALPLLKGS